MRKYIICLFCIFFLSLIAADALAAGQNIATIQKAAEQGNAEAQFKLALMYYNGEGVPKDYANASCEIFRSTRRERIVLPSDTSAGLPACFIDGFAIYK